MRAGLIGKRVMVVEDELLVALLVEEFLQDAGCSVVGPFARVAEAMAALRTEPLDVALLDVNVAGEHVFPVARELERLGVPFLFVTGYGPAVLPRDRPHWEAQSKPFHSEQILAWLARKTGPG